MSLISRAPMSASVDIKQFAALEHRVDALVTQLQQLVPPLANSGKANHKGARPSFLPRGTSFNLPLTPEDSPSTPDISLPGSQDVLASDNGIAVTDRPSAQVATRILDIIQRYGHNATSREEAWPGKTKFMPLVEAYVSKHEPVQMVLPAFPFKSPNRKDKTLGSLPDLGEELALMHLNGLCESITEVYEHGAKVVITSDGLVYNDLMGIDDSEVWDYSTAIRDIIRAKELRHVSALRIVDLLGHSNTENLSKEEYLTHAGCYRRELVAKYAPGGFSALEAVRSDKDTCMTYRGYIKFLTKDLMYSPLAKQTQGQESPKKRYKDAIENLAYQMISRGKAFAAAIEAKCNNFVRLSIHPSTGQAKLSIPLIPPPKGAHLMTPWHSSVAVGLDGSFRTVHAEDVRDTHDLIYRNGRPYHFREKSELYDFGETKVEFEHLYPCGLVIRPVVESGERPPSFHALDSKKLRKLTEHQSPVVLRGFADTTDREQFIGKAYELGEVLPWTFGILQEVKDAKRSDKQGNNVTSSEAMPMHFDGMFKFVAKIDEEGNELKDEQGNVIKYQKPPKFQYFTSVATAPKGTGYTLFAASRLFFKYLPAPYTVERLEAVKWRMDNDGFWDAKIGDLPLVVRHPQTNAPCMRWHEPWPASKTKFSTCVITIENDSQDIVQLVDQLIYDRRVCLRFTWEQGDILLSDNTAMLHTRTAFTDDSDRELWRIHFD
ncbi:MAG: hypothetical protein LQ341_000328 [Variospora aurantia]|nr:MAG: hypothetical protein LQ341_000328 [Variospora aurantia]